MFFKRMFFCNIKNLHKKHGVGCFVLQTSDLKEHKVSLLKVMCMCFNDEEFVILPILYAMDYISQSAVEVIGILSQEVFVLKNE